MKMAKSKGCKTKLLLLERLFKERTDSTHTIGLSDIMNELEKLGITAERKALYDDIDALRAMGMDIRLKGRGRYYLAENVFSAADLKLLAELIASSRLISAKKSAEMCGKLETLASIYTAPELKRNVFVADRMKASDGDVMGCVNAVQAAVAAGVKLSFKYISYITGTDVVLAENGRLFTVSPLGVIRSGGIYYIAADMDGEDRLFRADRVTELVTEKEPSVKRKYNPAEFAAKIDPLYSENPETVTVECGADAPARLYDIFGRDMSVVSPDGETYLISVKTALNREFFGLIASLDGVARIILPEYAAEEYEDFAKGLVAEEDEEDEFIFS